MSLRPENMAVTSMVDEALDVNWVAMFAAYCGGSTLAEISQTYAVPLAALHRVADTQGWVDIAARVSMPPDAPAPLKALTENRIALLEENRRKNYDLADALRQKLAEDFQLLRQGKLKVERVMTARTEVIHVEVDPGPQDLVALANAAKSVADMTYRALGDVAVEEKTAAANGTAQAITVILPTVIHAGAPEHAPTRVVDLRPSEITMSTPRPVAPAPESTQRPLAASIDDVPSLTP